MTHELGKMVGRPMIINSVHTVIVSIGTKTKCALIAVALLLKKMALK